MDIMKFAALVQEQTLASLLKRHPDYPQKCLAHQTGVKVKPGKKYTKVDVGRSGKYMVVNDTGEIFGIKAYGVIHRGHAYGTLETIAQWYWGEYNAYKL